MNRPRRSPAYESGSAGHSYTDEQAAWLRAVAAFHARHRRYPTMPEALRMAKAMGYRRGDR